MEPGHLTCGLALGLVGVLLVTAVTSAQAAQHQGGAIAVYRNFHGANGFWNIDRNANASRGTCGPFAGEGTGLSCRVPYSFSTTVYYRYRVWRLEADTGGQWWGAWMINMSTGAETHIGAIRVARTKTLTTTPLNFSEYWGDAVACTNVPVSVADFTQPAANSQGGGLYEFGSAYSGFSRGGCTGGTVNVVDLTTTRAARTTLGGP